MLLFSGCLSRHGSPLPIDDSSFSLLSGDGLMALPPRAYAEQQRFSPIRVEGVIQRVVWSDTRCRIVILLESVKRNTTATSLASGDVIVVTAIAAQDSRPEAPAPAERKAFVLGVPDVAVRIPRPSTRTEAWLRPVAVSGDRSGPGQASTFEVMAGPYGFGPSLED